MIQDLTILYTGLHPLGKFAVVALGILLLLAMIKRLVKLGILVAILLILIFVVRYVIREL